MTRLAARWVLLHLAVMHAMACWCGVEQWVGEVLDEADKLRQE